MSLISLSATFQIFAQNNNQMLDAKQSDIGNFATEPITEIILPILFIGFLIFIVVSMVKYFLDYRLKNKLINKGMSEQLSAYLVSKNDKEKQNEIIKLVILFCGIGIGLLVTYFSSPIDIHSLAIMSFSIGLSYLAYSFYLKKYSK